MALDTTGEKGDLSTVTSSIPGFTSLQGQVDYGYDHKRQLTLEDSDRHGGYSDANSFDGAGNATTFRNNARTYNADNQLTGPGTYVYDGNGNPTTWSGTSLTFDVENRMTAYGTSLTAGYRGDGLRAWKNTASGQTYFLYDGISVVCELDSSGNVLAGSTYGAAGLLSRGSVQYQFDNLGDATIRLDGSGNVLSYRLFDAWGNELSGGTEPYGYRARYGYYADGETGLIALAFRYYAPGVGRFLNRDPIRTAGGVAMYHYVRNSPTAQNDPAALLGVATGPSSPFLSLVNTLKSSGCYCAAELSASEAYTAQAQLLARRPDWQGSTPGQNDRIDAFRHCVLMCLITKRAGKLCAFLASEQHEKLQFGEASMMDRYNNYLAIQFTDQIGCQDCVSCCESAVLTTALYWLDPPIGPAPWR